MENMRVPELKALAKERVLRRYSRLRKAELIALLNTSTLPPPRPTPPPQPPQPTPPLTARQIKRKKNKINKLNKQIKSSEKELRKLKSESDLILDNIDGGKKFKSQRKRIRNLSKRLIKIDESIAKFEKVLDSAIDRLEPTPPSTKRIERKISDLNRKIRRAKKNKVKESLIAKRESLRSSLADAAWNPEAKVLEGAFSRAYRRYRIDDYDTFFSRIKSQLIIALKKARSNKVQTTTWISFRKDDELVRLAFNSRMMEVHNLSEINEIANEMIAHMKRQIENPALLNSRFVFDEVLFMDIDFHQLNLRRGSSYIPLPEWLANKKAIINPHNEDQECFKWAVIAALRWEQIGKDPQRVCNLKKYEKDFDWSELKFPVSIKDIKSFETKNKISINLLAIEDKEIYICKKGENHNRSINLMILDNHYVAIKSLSRLLSSKNSKHKGKEHFCTNWLQGFHSEISKCKHMIYCSNNESVEVEMPYKRPIVEFCDRQYQFKVPFIMYADFETILEPIQGPGLDPKRSWTIGTNNHVPSGW